MKPGLSHEEGTQTAACYGDAVTGAWDEIHAENPGQILLRWSNEGIRLGQYM